MLKVLIKKQLSEIFRSFFYDAKKNRARSRGQTVALLMFYVLLMTVFVGGLFVSLSLSLCEGLAQAGVPWLYYTVMGLLSVFMGVFGSVFNTYAGLYLAKDNDLLLSMPIPVRTVIASRLLGVYLMGLMYSAIVILPAVVVYWIKASCSFAAVAGGLLLTGAVSALVLILSCALGWVVARVSLKLKNKSFITVLISLAFFGLYYFFYFKATTLIRALVENAALYGEKIRGAAYGLYLFGRAGVGDPVALAVLIGLSAGLTVLTLWVLSRSFLRIATANGAVSNAKYKEKAHRQKGADSALLRREWGRFLSSPNYMLNCGLGTLLLPAAGIALLFRGADIAALLPQVFGNRDGLLPVLLCAVVCMLASMNDTATPSVSLEGKTLWIAQSLPVHPWQILRAKLGIQLLLTLPAALVCLICGAAALRFSVFQATIACLTAVLYVICNAEFCLWLGLRSPNLTWTNEVIPIKQNFSVMIAMFGGWGYALLLGGGYLLFGDGIGAELYLGGFAALTLFACVFLHRFLRTKGAESFRTL